MAIGKNWIMKILLFCTASVCHLYPQFPIDIYFPCFIQRTLTTINFLYLIKKIKLRLFLFVIPHILCSSTFPIFQDLNPRNSGCLKGRQTLGGGADSAPPIENAFRAVFGNFFHSILEMYIN